MTRDAIMLVVRSFPLFVSFLFKEGNSCNTFGVWCLKSP
jgi:hypothetical protein